MSNNNQKEQLYPSELSVQQSKNISDLTRDEKRVVQECSNESFYFRSLPFGIILTFSVHRAVKAGYFTSHPKYGAIPKMIGAAAMGYFIGKVSYINQCREKLMKLENSPLAEKMKSYKKKQETFKELPISETPMISNEALSQHDRFSSPLIEEYHPDLSHHAEGSDSYDSVTDSLSPYTTPGEPTRNESLTNTYDDLRKRNREKYTHKVSDSYSRRTQETPHDIDSAVPRSNPEPYFNPNKNKYGDLWDK